jgi:probable F420-dependent oxidoreductase
MTEIKYGVFLPSFWSDYGSQGPSGALREVAGAADALGYDSVWACDHIVASEQHAGSARCLEPLVLMASLASLYPHLKVGTDVLVLPQRSAMLVAKQAATLDVLSEGRFILGIGAGWSEDEFRYLNADFERRGAHTDEAIAVMRRLWGETPASYAGTFYNFKDAYFYPRPTGDGPPVWVGGGSPPAVRRAALLGDAWMPFWGEWDGFVRDQSKFQRQVGQLREQSSGRQVLIAANVPVRLAGGAQTASQRTSYAPEQIDLVLQIIWMQGWNM